MSFASIQGVNIGQSIKSGFAGNNDGITIGTDILAYNTVLAEGSYVFTTNFSVYSQRFQNNDTLMTCKVVVRYGGVLVAQQKVENQEEEEVSLTGVVFSNGIDELTIDIIGLRTTTLELAQLWGYSDGVINMVRITSEI